MMTLGARHKRSESSSEFVSVFLYLYIKHILQIKILFGLAGNSPKKNFIDYQYHWSKIRWLI